MNNVDGLNPTPSLDWKNGSVGRRTHYGMNLIITREIFNQLMNRLQGEKDLKLKENK